MKIFIVLLIIIILLYYKLNSNQIEHFYTFFKPYYSNDKLYNYDLYENKLYNNRLFNQKFNYNLIKVARKEKKNQFLDLMMRIILSNSNILNIKNEYYNDYKKLLKDLNNNNTQLTVLSYPLYDQIPNLNNIRYICTIDIKYIYICKRIDNYALKNFSYIYNNTKIGVYKNENAYIFITNLMKFIGLIEGSDYKLIIYNNETKLLNDLNNNKISIGVFSDIYPTNVFNKYYNLKLMELNGFRDNIFFEQYKQYYSKSLINLNRFGSNYLPKSYDQNIYNMTKADFYVISYETILLTNNNVPDNYINEILESITNNIEIFNKLPQYANSNIKYNTSIMNKVIYGIYPSNATLEYLNKYSYVSNIDNNNCKYFIGKKNCNEKNLLSLM